MLLDIFPVLHCVKKKKKVRNICAQRSGNHWKVLFLCVWRRSSRVTLRGNAPMW